jgi:imidazolonepropionase-like amidohydrolase
VRECRRFGGSRRVSAAAFGIEQNYNSEGDSVLSIPNRARRGAFAAIPHCVYPAIPTPIERLSPMKTLAAAFLLLIVSPSFAQVLAIRAGTIVDPARGSIAKDQVILVEHGKILNIGPKLEIPPGAEIVDLSKEWLTPGLIDTHTHMTLTELEGNAPFESFYLNQSSTLRGLHGLHNAQLVLYQGFTTLRDVGNSAEYAMSDVRRAIDAGWFVGPTIIDSGKIIAPFGGQSRDIPPRQGAFWQFEYIDADGPEEVRKAVRTNIYYGAGVIKLVADNNPYHYSVEELRAAVDEAHRAGIPVAVHVYSGDALDTCIEAGAFGSDTVIDMPGRTRADLMFDYLAVWREAGVPPADILKAMTANAAELLRIDKTRGSLSEGLSADMVAMPADPLSDIENLRKIDFVMKDGKVVRKPAGDR